MRTEVARPCPLPAPVAPSAVVQRRVLDFQGASQSVGALSDGPRAILGSRKPPFPVDARNSPGPPGAASREVQGCNARDDRCSRDRRGGRWGDIERQGRRAPVLWRESELGNAESEEAPVLQSGRRATAEVSKAAVLCIIHAPSIPLTNGVQSSAQRPPLQREKPRDKASAGSPPELAASRVFSRQTRDTPRRRALLP